MTITRKLAVTYRPTDVLEPYARNSRTHSERQVEQIAASITEFGFTQPILVDGKNGIIAGHGRLLAALSLGMAEVPTIELSALSEAQKRAYVIADNKLTLNGGWDDAVLADELKALGEEGFDLSLTGFDDVELVSFLATGEGLTDPDEVPDAPAQAVTRLADVWMLGNHRLICGDSTDTETVTHLMDGKLADMVFTDPPYGVSFQSGMSKGGTATRFDKLANDDRMLDIAPVIAGALRNDGAMFIWTSHQVYPQWREQFSEFYKHTIIWHKPGGGIGDLKGNYATDYELCLFGVKGAVRFRGKRGMAVWNIAKDGVTSYLHPTQKPVALAVRAIEDFTDAGYVVLDLFGGSGSTLIACEQTGRVARMAELDPTYADVIVMRWQAFTGREAVLAGTSATFAETAAQRAREAA